MDNSKDIKVILKKNVEEKIVLDFQFENDPICLNLETDDTNEIKEVFLRIAKEIRIQQITLLYSQDDSIKEKSDKLFIDTAVEYVKALNQDLLTLENDNNLKIIRKFNVED